LITSDTLRSVLHLRIGTLHGRSASAPASSDTLKFTDGACVSVYNTQRYLCNLPATTAHRLLRRQLPQPPLGRTSSYAVRLLISPTTSFVERTFKSQANNGNACQLAETGANNLRQQSEVY